MNSNEFPRMVYKAGGTEEIHGGRFHTHIVHGQDALDTALASGWHLTTPEAKAAAEKPAATGAAPGSGIPDDNAPPTRDELKHKATELGLAFAGNISTEKLAALVDTALAGGAKD